MDVTGSDARDARRSLPSTLLYTLARYVSLSYSLYVSVPHFLLVSFALSRLYYSTPTTFLRGGGKVNAVTRSPSPSLLDPTHLSSNALLHGVDGESVRALSVEMGDGDGRFSKIA